VIVMMKKKKKKKEKKEKKKEKMEKKEKKRLPPSYRFCFFLCSRIIGDA